MASLLVVVLVGCSGAGDLTKRATVATDGLVALLKSVQDEASAKAATGKLKSAFVDAAGAQAEVSVYLLKQVQGGNIRTAATEGVKMMETMERQVAAVTREQKRVESLRGLPVEFWSEYRIAEVEAEETAVAAVTGALGVDAADMLDEGDDPFKVVLAAFEKHGPEHVADVTITGGRYLDQEEAVERLRRLAGAAATVQVVPNDDDQMMDEEVTTVLVAPVADMQAFHDAIDFGTVADFIPERCGIVLEVPDDLAGPYAGMSEEEIAEQKRIDAEQAEAERKQREEQERMAAEQRAREEEEARRQAEEEERQRPPEPGK
ncbi:MAG: hypothetical protein KDA44_10035, partial [Planctomycetales bacterium]|nr:hypothetical protein [Planctomycetales bacterium]